MTSMMRQAWSGFLRPLFSRPDQLQVAALCYRQRPRGIEVLVISSLTTRRWILPKGWPMKGRDAADTAVAEAWEEAGVVAARVDHTPLGSFRYTKRMRGGAGMPCETLVYPIQVKRLSEDYPESGRRERRWLSPAKAAELLDDAGIEEIIQRLPERIASGDGHGSAPADSDH